jgi:hypothetical protein
MATNRGLCPRTRQAAQAPQGVIITGAFHTVFPRKRGKQNMPGARKHAARSMSRKRRVRSFPQRKRRCFRSVDVLFFPGASAEPNPRGITSHDDHADAPVSLLSRQGYCAPWHDLRRQATLSVPYMSPRAWTDVSLGVCLRWSLTCGEATDRRYGDACEWHA